MSPNQTHVEPVSAHHNTISATHLINTAYSIIVNLPTVHHACKPFNCQQRLENKSIMLPYLPSHLFGCADFGIEFLNNLNFDAEFDLGLEFAGMFEHDNFAGDVDYDGISVSCTCDNEYAPGIPSSRKKRCLNRPYWILLVKKSYWYVNYPKQGETRELMYDLTSSDWFGEFWYWFQMSFNQMENLTKKLIARGYLPQTRSWCRMAEYAERCKLLIMSALYFWEREANFAGYTHLLTFWPLRLRKFSIISLTYSWICAMSIFWCLNI